MSLMLNMEELPVEDLVKRFGTPLYLYDEKIVKSRLDLLKQSFADFEIFYSFKANPNRSLCSFIKAQGHCADTASIGEVRLALESGFKKDEIIYSAPGKTREEIKEALGKCLIIADSLNELHLINEVCRSRGIVEDVAIRINPDYSIEGTAALEVMSGFPSKFGIDQGALGKSLQEIRMLTNIRVIGIQIYMGSQIIDHQTLYNNFYNIFAVAKYCREGLGFELEFIDFGGGFGIQYHQDDPVLDIEKTGTMVRELLMIEEFNELAGLRLIIESGRFICGPAGAYVAKVLDTKESRGKKYAILDGGMNTFFRPIFIKENRYPIVKVGQKHEAPLEEITLGGVMCTPIDIFASDVLLPPVKKGDLLAFLNAGAYGYTMSLTKFISQKEAKELYLTADSRVLAAEYEGEAKESDFTTN